ncbi:MAG: dTDP-4-dehydrorhamnose reductase [Xanthobacteraceae bacterium]|nr:MAG: dTDP-4-dehydrorhamnose reductase [Xanthobacteraceae bacterium]
MQKILLLGKDGQLGWALQRPLALRGELVAHGRASCDLGEAQALRAAIRAAAPDVIVNAAAYTAVDRAESERDLCFRINAEAPRVIAEEAARANARLIHYSTDYVYDGAKTGAYVEADAPNPLGVYGASKLAGDSAVLAAGGHCLILRVSWVYGRTGNNFARTMLRLAAERDELKVVDDQIGAPTSVELIAEVTARWIDRWQEGGEGGNGVYHLAPRGHTSWHGYAVELINEAARRGMKLKAGAGRIRPIAARDYPVAAARPANSVLDCARILAELPICLPDWRDDVRRFAAEMTGR